MINVWILGKTHQRRGSDLLKPPNTHFNLATRRQWELNLTNVQVRVKFFPEGILSLYSRDQPVLYRPALVCTLQTILRCTLQTILLCTLQTSLLCTLQTSLLCTLQTNLLCTLQTNLLCTLQTSRGLYSTLQTSLLCTLQTSLYSTDHPALYSTDHHVSVLSILHPECISTVLVALVAFVKSESSRAS